MPRDPVSVLLRVREPGPTRGNIASDGGLHGVRALGKLGDCCSSELPTCVAQHGVCSHAEALALRRARHSQRPYLLRAARRNEGCCCTNPPGRVSCGHPAHPRTSLQVCSARVRPVDLQSGESRGGRSRLAGSILKRFAAISAATSSRRYGARNGLFRRH